MTWHDVVIFTLNQLENKLLKYNIYYYYEGSTKELKGIAIVATFPMSACTRLELTSAQRECRPSCCQTMPASSPSRVGVPWCYSCSHHQQPQHSVYLQLSANQHQHSFETSSLMKPPGSWPSPVCRTPSPSPFPLWISTILPTLDQDPSTILQRLEQQLYFCLPSWLPKLS